MNDFYDPTNSFDEGGDYHDEEGEKEESGIDLRDEADRHNP